MQRAGVGLLGFLIALSSAHAQPPPADAAIPLSGKRERAMRNCPSAVEGAQTKTRRTKDGIEVTVTASRPDARQEIITRAQQLARQPGRRTGADPHNGRGGGTELIGYCPVIVRGNTLTTQTIPDGIEIKIRPRDRDLVGLIQAKVESRATYLRDHPYEG